MRKIELGVRFDVPRTRTGWLIIADQIEARFSYLNRKKIAVNPCLGFTWAVDVPHAVELSRVWEKLALHVAPRICETTENMRMSGSSIIEATNGPHLWLRIEGD